ncbi:hypothetical protein [Constantimarinum furrinae]|nr:hypothetical protein [Constantimarinum furrinae]
MEKALNYPFQRRSANFMEWLYDHIKSEKYIQTDAIILSNDIENIKN